MTAFPSVPGTHVAFIEVLDEINGEITRSTLWRPGMDPKAAAETMATVPAVYRVVMTDG